MKIFMLGVIAFTVLSDNVFADFCSQEFKGIQLTKDEIESISSKAHVRKSHFSKLDDSEQLSIIKSVLPRPRWRELSRASRFNLVCRAAEKAITKDSCSSSNLEVKAICNEYRLGLDASSQAECTYNGQTHSACLALFYARQDDDASCRGVKNNSLDMHYAVCIGLQNAFSEKNPDCSQKIEGVFSDINQLAEVICKSSRSRAKPFELMSSQSDIKENCVRRVPQNSTVKDLASSVQKIAVKAEEEETKTDQDRIVIRDKIDELKLLKKSKKDLDLKVELEAAQFLKKKFPEKDASIDQGFYEAFVKSLQQLKQSGFKDVTHDEVYHFLLMLHAPNRYQDWRYEAIEDRLRAAGEGKQSRAEKEGDLGLTKKVSYFYDKKNGFHLRKDSKQKKSEQLMAEVELIPSGFLVQFKSKKLGSGGFKTVQTGITLRNPGQATQSISPLTPAAVLNFKESDDSPVLRDYENKIYDLLRKADPKKREGIVEPPTKIISYGKEKWIQKLYEKGDLRTQMKKDQLKNPGQALAILEQVAQGLENIHEIGLVHADIKPENVLLDKDGNAVIADLGLARPKKAYYLDLGGTPGYMAPELFISDALLRKLEQSDLEKLKLGQIPEGIKKEDLPSGTGRDTFAFGVMLDEMMKRHDVTNPKFYFVEDKEFYKENWNKRLQAWEKNKKASKFDSELEKLILDCTHPDPSERPNDKDLRKRLARLKDLDQARSK